MERGRAEAAERAFKRTVELAPKWVPGHLALANHYWAAGKTAEAEQALRTALALDPTNPVTNRAMAVFYVATNKPDRAEPYIKALAASGAAPFALADFYLLRNRPTDAIPELQQLRGIGENGQRGRSPPGAGLRHAGRLRRRPQGRRRAPAEGSQGCAKSPAEGAAIGAGGEARRSVRPAAGGGSDRSRLRGAAIRLRAIASRREATSIRRARPTPRYCD